METEKGTSDDHRSWSEIVSCSCNSSVHNYVRLLRRANKKCNVVPVAIEKNIFAIILHTRDENRIEIWIRGDKI